MTIDEISKDSFWMVATCDKDWPNDFTNMMCSSVSIKKYFKEVFQNFKHFRNM